MSWDQRHTGLEDPDACVHCGGPCDHPTVGPDGPITPTAVGFAVVVLVTMLFWLAVFGVGAWLAASW